MAKRTTTEDALARISAIRHAPGQYDLAQDLAPFLRHKSNHVIAAAADLIKRLEAASLSAVLISAFLELFPKAVERDQGCKALIAIAGALVCMGEDAAEAYLKGVVYVQLEGSFGPPIDVAAPLRGLCVRGLVRMRHPEALFKAVALLTDTRVPARVGAVQALGDSGSREAELLLRLKVLQGDEADVIAECFVSLLAAAPERSVPFVAEQLAHASEDRVEAAALALGESRIPAALPYLFDAWARRPLRAIRRSLLLSIAVSRREEAVEFLMARLDDQSEQSATDVLDALAIYQNEESVQTRIAEIVARRKLPWTRPR